MAQGLKGVVDVDSDGRLEHEEVLGCLHSLQVVQDVHTLHEQPIRTRTNEDILCLRDSMGDIY